MSRPRRFTALVLASVLLTALAAPSAALAVCNEYSDECGGGGGGGYYPTVPTSVSISAPAAAPYTQIQASASVLPSQASGYLTISAAGGSRTELISGTALTIDVGVAASFVGQSVPVSASFTGDNYIYLPSAAPSTSVYVYGSHWLNGTFTLNGQPVSGAAVTLVDSTQASVASSVTNVSGVYTIAAPVTTAAEAQKTYALRITHGGVNYFYNGSTFTTTFANASMGGPTQWRPGVNWNVHAATAPTWPTPTTRVVALGVPFSTFLGATSYGATSYSVVSGTLPAGLSLNPATGEVSGTATEFGNQVVTFRATNSYGSASTTIGFRVDGVTSVTFTAPVVAPYTGFTGTVIVSSAAGTPPGNVRVLNYAWQTLVNGSATFAVAAATEWIGTTATYKTDYSAPGAPWVSSSGSTGVYIYGSHSVSGTFRQNGVVMPGATIELESTSGAVIDATTTDASGRYTLSVPTPTTIAEAQATYRIKATTPGGHASGYYVAGATQTSATGTTATASLTGPTQWRPGSNTQSFYMVTNPVFTDDNLATPRVDSVYSDGVTATDPATLYYGIASGALPAGLALNPSTGALTGTPTSTATATFTLRAYTNPIQFGYTDRSYTITPLRAGIVPSFTDSGLGDVVTGRALSDGVLASGDPTITYAIISGALPDGLDLNTATGAVAGTTVDAGAYSATIRATNEFGHADAVVAGSVRYATATTLTVPATASYSSVDVRGTVVAAGATPTGAMHWSFGAETFTGALHAGADFFGRGVDESYVGSTLTTSVQYAGNATFAPSSDSADSYIYGTDRVMGIVTENGIAVEGATVRLHDGATVVDSTVTDEWGRYELAVDASTVALATATYTISATHNGAVSWYYDDADATDPTPAIDSATATGPTDWRWYDSLNLHFSTAPTWTDLSLPSPREGSSYSDGVSASTPGGTLQYEIFSGALPLGLQLDTSTGAITGTPVNQDAATFSVRAYTEYGWTATSFVLQPLRPGIAPTFTDSSIGGFQVGAAFADAVAASGDPAITYTLSGIYPAGIVIDAATGELSGTPLYNGPFDFTIRAQNDFGHVEADFEGWVDAAPVADVRLGFMPGTALSDATLTIEADGLLMGSDYSLTMFSTPRVLISGTVGGFRSFSHTVSLPADTPVGAHRLELAAVGFDGTPIVVTAYFSLLENGRIGAVSLTGPVAFAPVAVRLAAAGTDPLLPVGLGAMLLAAGLVLVRRRRQV